MIPSFKNESRHRRRARARAREREKQARSRPEYDFQLTNIFYLYQERELGSSGILHCTFETFLTHEALLRQRSLSSRDSSILLFGELACPSCLARGDKNEHKQWFLTYDPSEQGEGISGINIVPMDRMPKIPQVVEPYHCFRCNYWKRNFFGNK